MLQVVQTSCQNKALSLYIATKHRWDMFSTHHINISTMCDTYYAQTTCIWADCPVLWGTFAGMRLCQDGCPGRSDCLRIQNETVFIFQMCLWCIISNPQPSSFVPRPNICRNVQCTHFILATGLWRMFICQASNWSLTLEQIITSFVSLGLGFTPSLVGFLLERPALHFCICYTMIWKSPLWGGTERAVNSCRFAVCCCSVSLIVDFQILYWQ